MSASINTEYSWILLVWWGWGRQRWGLRSWQGTQISPEPDRTPAPPQWLQLRTHCGPHWHCSRADGATSLLVMSWRGLITNCVRGLPYNIYTPAQGYSDIIYNLHIDGLYRYLASARCDTFPRYSVSPLSHSDHVTPCHRHTRSAGRIHATPHSLEPDEKITVALEIYF